MTISEKYNNLKEYLFSLKSVAVAFSGGVDSRLLLKVAHDVLDDKAVAITAFSSLFPHRDFMEASKFCADNKITLIMCPINSLEINGIKENPINRCYLCKKDLFTRLLARAKENNLAYVVEGSNVDDLSDFRPGMKALDELGIQSPLRKAGLTKAEIRELSKSLGLPTWNKPSFACLASRFVYGEPITKEKLKMVEDAEQLLMDLGFKQFRVRIHGKIARIEVMPEDFCKLIEENTRSKIYDTLKNLGFSYVTLDLKGYRAGSMNEGELLQLP
ncbi:MAG: ATP-dependent sacrificial sulfur transferase LarE [Synergistales bacterium]|nr:ATP-dependent sacrificial sulfur transferase LarE [Synergistales bacterium]MDY6401773.1 ATP-dependent sacrificial sulfur transferase LarE [Synergistales bacterium]MDY6403956.1 ATP-dependent sacrificial sulfur transferase LarE [Synergistales bacterium]MDY6411314.1 ATP-dependent sacrificial sulfur transferase LarE [Synergistales bacterium]MDY6414561.1 ATP-dependent sacrificial sulfur transferase LarE [Synergistales bacterium]